MVMEPLSDRTEAVASLLFRTVLPCANLVVTVGGLSEDQVKRGLRELKRAALLETHEMGCLLPPAPVAVWTEPGLDQFEANDLEMSWFGRDGVGYLVQYHFAKVEAVNSVAPFYATGGWRLERTHFFTQQPMIAAAEYHHPDHHDPAYVVYCWMSMLENQREMFERISALEEAMQAVSVDPSHTFWPAGIALLATSEWDAARALCLAPAALDGWVHGGCVAGWYYGSGGWHMSTALSARTGEPPKVMPPLLDPVYTLRPSLSVRKLGRRRVDNILTGSLWSGPGGHKLVELLTLVAAFPCGSVAHYQGLMGERPGGTDTRKRLKRLTRLGLIEIVTERGRAKRRRRWPKDTPVTLSGSHHGAHRYAASLAGRVQFCYVHGRRPQDLFSRTRLGRLKTLVRGKALLRLLNLSWMVHLLHAPVVRPLELSDLDKLARNWKKLHKEVLLQVLMLHCVVQLNHAPGPTQAAPLSSADLARIWSQLRDDMVEDHWLYQHEDIVYEILGQAREQGCAFAPGWQAWTTLADERRIEPDGILFLTTPWGRWWCYLEVELSDQTYEDVLPRCKKYGSRKRRDNLPVLIVCRDDQAEGNFHRAAADSNLPPRMLTTTLRRLKEGGMFGPGVWSRYGRLVTLAP